MDILLHDTLHILTILRLPGKLSISFFNEVHKVIILPHLVLKLPHQSLLSCISFRLFDCICVFLRNVRAWRWVLNWLSTVLSSVLNHFWGLTCLIRNCGINIFIIDFYSLIVVQSCLTIIGSKRPISRKRLLLDSLCHDCSWVIRLIWSLL